MVEAKADNPMDDILQMDDAVDTLSPLQVKDAWARMRLMRTFIDANGSRWIATDECDDVEGMLSRYAPQGIKEATIAAVGRGPLSRAFGWEAGRGNIETAFAQMMLDKCVDGYSAARTPTENVYTEYEMVVEQLDGGEERLVEKARAELKNALRGCGMPDINVARERVRAHARGDTDV